MKKNNKKSEKSKEQKQYDKGQIFVKVMAGVLVIMMLAGTAISFIYALL